MIGKGHYDYVNSDITAEHFPMRGSGSVESDIYLLHFNRILTSDTVLREMEAHGLRPATLPELLAFGSTYPDKQKEFPIIALGSVWRGGGSRNVPYLGCWIVKRRLDLYWFDDGWDGDCRFAAVRK